MYKMNMKSLFGVAVILVSTPCARAYIDENPIGRQSSPFSVTDWSPKTFAPKIRENRTEKLAKIIVKSADPCFLTCTFDVGSNLRPTAVMTLTLNHFSRFDLKWRF